MIGGPRTFDYDEAHRLRSMGLTYTAIGEQLGVTAEAVRYACRGLVIKTRSTSAATVDRRRRENTGEAERAFLRRFAALTAHDPPVRADGKCAVCGRQRRPDRSAKYAQGCAEIDAFCSSTCARKWHGTSLPAKPTHPGRPAKVAICGTGTAYKQGCRCDACRAVTADYQTAKRARQRARREEAA